MNIAWALNQIATWIPLARDAEGDPVASPSGALEFGVPVKIKVRFEYESRRIVSRDGTTITSQSRCFTAAAVRKGDIIVYDGKKWPVDGVSIGTGLDGEESFRTLYL